MALVCNDIFGQLTYELAFFASEVYKLYTSLDSYGQVWLKKLENH